MKKKLRKTAIAFFVGASIASSLSLLKVGKENIVGFTAVVLGAGLMIALKDEDDLNKKSRDYEYFFNRAQDEFEVANYEEAILDYNKALKLSPTEICLVYSMRGNAKRNLGDIDGAISDQNKALGFDPLYIDGYFNRSSAKLKKGDFTGAIDDQNKALDFDPLYADGYFNRSSAKFNMGDFAGAIDDYSQVLRINPMDSDAYFNRANIKKEIGDLNGACEDWIKAVDLRDKEAAKLLKENCE